jgi:hypothetical protein
MQHPNIVEIYEFGHRDGLNYFSMRLIEGPSLAQRLSSSGPLPAREAAKLLRTLAEAMDYAHRLGVLHLDLKPANILIGHDGQPLIADFGLARRIDAGHDGGNDEISGTPSYMAPEQALLQSHPLSASTDIYGLGAILYEVLTGRPPFVAADAQATLERVISEPPAAPRSLRKELSPDLEAICVKCLEKAPVDRYASARDLAEDLGRFLDGHAVSVRPLSSRQRLARWVRREPKLAAAVSAALLALTIGIAATTVQWRRAEQALIESKAQRTEANRKAAAAMLTGANQVASDMLMGQISHQLSTRSRQQRFQALINSPDPDDWLLAALVGMHMEVLPDEPEFYDKEFEDTIESMRLGAGAQLRRLLTARPTDRLGLLTAITFCDEWRCAVPGAADQLSRLDPDNLFAWTALMKEPGTNRAHFVESLAQVGIPGAVHDRVGLLVARAAQARRWDDGYGQILAKLVKAYEVSYLPLPYSNGLLGADKDGTIRGNTLGWAFASYSTAWSVPPPSLQIVAEFCNPKKSNLSATSRADCLRIGNTLADSRGHLLVNAVGLTMLRRLEKGSPAEAALLERRRRLAWLQEQDLWPFTGDPVRTGQQFVNDLSRYGELEASLRRLDRLGISRVPPATWQPKDENTLLLPEERVPRGWKYW